MGETLYSFNELKYGDRFTSKKHIGTYTKVRRGDTLFHTSDNLVLSENGEIDLWTDDINLLNEKCLIKIEN